MTDSPGEEYSIAPSTPATPFEVELTSSLKDLQTDEHRKVLDVVAQLRKCGLESVLSLPQIVSACPSTVFKLPQFYPP